MAGEGLPVQAATRVLDVFGAGDRAARCPAGRDDWWGPDRAPAPLLPDRSGCVLHPSRVTCLLSAARRALAIGTLDSERMRKGLQDVEARPTTTPEDIWELRDAGRDTYTPAADAVAQLLPAEYRFADVHVGMLSAAGDLLDLPCGRVPVPEPMRRSLQRQRTTSVLCNGPADYPLLTLMDKYVANRG